MVIQLTHRRGNRTPRFLLERVNRARRFLEIVAMPVVDRRNASLDLIEFSKPPASALHSLRTANRSEWKECSGRLPRVAQEPQPAAILSSLVPDEPRQQDAHRKRRTSSSRPPVLAETGNWQAGSHHRHEARDVSTAFALA